MLEEVHISSTSFLREELLSAMSSDDLDDLTGEEFNDSDLDDITSLTLSDMSSFVPQMQERPAAEQEMWGTSRDVEMEHLKRANKQQVSELKIQLEEMQHQCDLKEIKIQHFHRRYEEELHMLRTSHAQELNPMREKVTKLERELSVAKASVEQKKDYIVDGLRISDAEYEEIMALPPESRDLRQVVGAMAWDRIAEVKKVADAAKREAEALRESLAGSSKELESVHGQWDDAQRKAAALQVEHSRAMSDIKHLNSALQGEVDRMRQELLIHEERSKRCEQADAAAAQAQAERVVESAKVQTLEEAVQRLEEANAELKSQVDSSAQVLAVLELDKQYLQKENAELTVRCERAEDKVEKKAFKVKEAVRAREQAEQQLMQQQALASATSEDRMQAELASLRHRSEAEIAAIKQSTAELYERQNLMLLQQRDEAVAAQERLEARLESATRERESAVREHSQLAGSVEAQIGEVRGQLRVKGMELQRLQVAYEDAQALNRQLRLESEMFREKLEVLRAEYHALQNATGSKIVALEASLKHAEANSLTLDAVENNLNMAVDSMDAASQAVQAETEAQLLQLGASLPSDNHRRLAQTMFLARKVVTQQREVTDLKQTVQAQEETIANLTADLNDKNKLLDSASQPHELLVSAIRGRDEELSQTRQALHRVKAVLAVTQRDRDELREHCGRLKRDIEAVAAKRGAADGLQQALAELQTQQKASELRLHMLRQGAAASPGGSAGAEGGGGAGQTMGDRKSVV